MTSKSNNDSAFPYGKTVLVLQGGGALGAYQAGAYQAIHGAGLAVDWVAGISIGAINAAIIAGNPPAERMTRLETFWDTITHDFNHLFPAVDGQYLRLWRNRSSALGSLTWGVNGFFRPRIPPPVMHPRGSENAISFYDTSALRDTLEQFVDFGLVNDSNVRLSLGATNVRTGNFVYFDNTQTELRPEHVMASGALPPGLPPVQVGDEYYWDGGIVSNTPLHYVLDQPPDADTLIFQVDLFSARGAMPQDIFEVEERKKDIVYSSRTRLNTDVFHEKRKLRRAILHLRDRMPEELREDPDVRELCDLGQGNDNEITIVHVIYRHKHYESQSKDYEFSQLSMREHWRAGHEDTLYSIRCPDWRAPSKNREGLHVFDMQR